MPVEVVQDVEHLQQAIRSRLARMDEYLGYCPWPDEEEVSCDACCASRLAGVMRAALALPRLSVGPGAPGVSWAYRVIGMSFVNPWMHKSYGREAGALVVGYRDRLWVGFSGARVMWPRWHATAPRWQAGLGSLEPGSARGAADLLLTLRSWCMSADLAIDPLVAWSWVERQPLWSPPPREAPASDTERRQALVLARDIGLGRGRWRQLLRAHGADDLERLSRAELHGLTRSLRWLGGVSDPGSLQALG